MNEINENNHSNNNYSIQNYSDGNYGNDNDNINGITSRKNHNEDDFYDFYGSYQNGSYENNPLLDLFESSSSSTSSLIKQSPFTGDLDYDHPMYSNNAHGHIDTTYSPYNRSDSPAFIRRRNEHHRVDRNMSRRNENRDRDKDRKEGRGGNGNVLATAWVEGILLNPLTAVQVAAANINPLGLESLGLGSWLDILNKSKGIDNYEYLAHEINPLHIAAVIMDTRVLQTDIRKRYVQYICSSDFR